MKKTYIIIIIITTFLAILLGYKLSCLTKYTIKENYNYKITDSLEIKQTTSKNKFKFKNITFKNIIKDYEIEEEKDNSILLTNNKNSIKISINNSNTNELITNNKNIKEYFKENKINNDLDLIKYTIKNKNKKYNIFTSKNKLKNNYDIIDTIVNNIPSNHEIIELKGSNIGYILKSDKYRNINILKNNKVYNITMIIQDKESTIDNLVNDILYSLEIN